MSTNAEKTRDDLEALYCTTSSDVLNEILKRHKLSQTLRRIFIIGRLEYKCRENVQEKILGIIKKLQMSITDENSKITGVLIVHKKFFYHAAECSDWTVGQLVEETVCLVKERVIQGAKVVRTSSLAQRWFLDWNSFIIKSPTFVDDGPDFLSSYVVTESDVPTLGGMIRSLEDAFFVMASYIRFLKPGEIADKMNELVPLAVLLSDEELKRLYQEKFFLEVSEYCRMYVKPLQYTSYLELEWPCRDSKGFFNQLDQAAQEAEKQARECDEVTKRKDLKMNK